MFREKSLNIKNEVQGWSLRLQLSGNESSGAGHILRTEILYHGFSLLATVIAPKGTEINFQNIYSLDIELLTKYAAFYVSNPQSDGARTSRKQR